MEYKGWDDYKRKGGKDIIISRDLWIYFKKDVEKLRRHWYNKLSDMEQRLEPMSVDFRNIIHFIHMNDNDIRCPNCSAFDSTDDDIN